MSRVGRFVAVEELVVAWLKSRGLRAGTKLPNPIPDNFVWVGGIGGPSDYDMAAPRVDLNCFHAGTAGAAKPVAKSAHEAMAALDGQTVGGQPVYNVYCRSMPAQQFWSADVDRV